MFVKLLLSPKMTVSLLKQQEARDYSEVLNEPSQGKMIISISLAKKNCEVQCRIDREGSGW